MVNFHAAVVFRALRMSLLSEYFRRAIVLFMPILYRTFGLIRCKTLIFFGLVVHTLCSLDHL